MNIKRAFLIILLLFAFVSAFYFLFRNTLLNIAIEKISRKLAGYNLEFHARETGFEGIATVYAKDISLTPVTGDTLMQFHYATASFSLLQLLQGNYPVDNLVIENGFLHLEEYPDSTTNYSGLLNRKKNATESDTLIKREPANFLKLFNNGWSYFSKLAGLNFLVKDFEIAWNSPSTSEKLLLNEVSVRNAGFNLDAGTSSGNEINPIKIIGTFDPAKGLIVFHGSSESNKIIYFPFVKKISGFNFFSESFGGRLQIIEESSSEINLNVQAAAVKPGVNHWRIGPDDVLLDSVGLNADIEIQSRSVQINESSHLIVNRLPLHFKSEYSKNENTRLMLQAGFDSVAADDFFNSLPGGLFYTLEGIKTEGSLTYRLLFDVNLQQPDSLVFESELKKEKFKIKEFGNEKFTYINRDFNYEAREKDRVVRNVLVGEANNFYTPLTEISPVLINCVLVSEDGTFFFHKGFNEEAFRKSMATNIREKRFARGGSTITMQLVKNVFLSRNKTISRKIEEALIVWLIENQKLVTKERILEVYLNIIEWGPGIYGIGEASDFYFSKKPMQLSLDESIFLASIIPRPKYFKYSFEKDGSLKTYLTNYFDVVAGRLLKKEIIGQEEFDKMTRQVILTGRALEIVVPVDSLPPDSIIIDNAGEID